MNKNYNSKYIVVSGVKVCYYCGSKMNEWEDRIGCDYREDGQYYCHCTCEASEKEQEFMRKVKQSDYESKLQHAKRLDSLKEEYKDILKQNYDEKELRYKIELEKLNQKFDK